MLDVESQGDVGIEVLDDMSYTSMGSKLQVMDTYHPWFGTQVFGHICLAVHCSRKVHSLRLSFVRPKQPGRVAEKRLSDLGGTGQTARQKSAGRPGVGVEASWQGRLARPIDSIDRWMDGWTCQVRIAAIPKSAPSKFYPQNGLFYPYRLIDRWQQLK